MAEYFNRGESIEGRKLGVFSRKIVKDLSLLKCNVIGRCVKYKCDRNSSAEITQELVVREKANLRNESSKISLNDKLKCDALFVLHEGNKHLSIQVKEGKTATHGGQLLDTDSRSYAEIVTPFDHIEKALLKRKHELGVSPHNHLGIIED